jgi:hypothetical protein
MAVGERLEVGQADVAEPGLTGLVGPLEGAGELDWPFQQEQFRILLT